MPIWQMAEEYKVSPETVRWQWTYEDLLKAQAISQMRQAYIIADDELTREGSK